MTPPIKIPLKAENISGLPEKETLTTGHSECSPTISWGNHTPAKRCKSSWNFNIWKLKIQFLTLQNITLPWSLHTLLLLHPTGVRRWGWMDAEGTRSKDLVLLQKSQQLLVHYFSLDQEEWQITNIFCKIPSFSSTNLQSAEPLTRIQFSWVVETNGQAIQTASPHLHPTFVITPVCCCQKLHLHQGISTARTYKPTSFTEGSLSLKAVFLQSWFQKSPKVYACAQCEGWLQKSMLILSPKRKWSRQDGKLIWTWVITELISAVPCNTS